ncbi:MAG: MFS transporter [Acidimicrobiia bacterium]
MSEANIRRPFTAVLLVSFAAFIALGLGDGALGVAWPSMQGEFARGVADLGLLITVGSLGYLTASFSYGWLHGRAGTGPLLVGGSSLMALGFVSIGVAPVWALLVCSSLVLGFGGGLVDSGLNAHAALAFDVRSINLLHACFGVGATLGPVIVTISLTASGVWRGGYVAIAFLQVVVLGAIWARRNGWQVSDDDDSVGSVVVARKRRSWYLFTLFFLYTGVEVATGQWAFSLLTESRGMSTASAGVWVAIYWGGLTVGRLLFGLVGNRVAPTRALGGSVLVAMTGLAILWVDPWGLGAFGLPIASLGLAAVFPTLISLTPSRIGRDRSTRSIGFQLGAASLGVAVIPWALGLVAESAGLEALGPGLFLVSALLALVHFVSAREARV